MNNIVFKEIIGTKQINESLDLNYLIKESHDIIRFDDVTINGQIDNFGDLVDIRLNVNTNIVLPCGRTFKEVFRELNFDIDATFSNEEDAEFKLESTLDLNQFVYSYILIEKPYVVFHESSNDEEFQDEAKKVNPAFAALIKK